MTTGSTYDFESSRDELIKDALVNVGALNDGPDGTPTGPQLLHAARVLNRLVKSIDPEGQMLWRVVRRTTTTTASTATFAPAADVLSIDEPMSYLRAAGGRQHLTSMSRDDFMKLTDRTVTGTPSLYFFERTLTTRTVTLWPIPDTTGDTIEYAAVIRSRDFDDGANTPDFPAEWTLCLEYGLSALLAPAYGSAELGNYYFERFQAEKTKLVQAETEHGNVLFIPRI